MPQDRWSAVTARLRTPWLALIALVVLAAYPLVRAGYPTITDGLIHFYRLVELDWNVRHGILYARWSTHLGFGYGFPVFNFYPPLTYYLAELFHLLGFRFDQSLMAVYVLGFGLAALGAFKLGLENFGGRAGIVAAAAYVLAPYLYFDFFGRAALPEFFSLSILPWALWSVQRLVKGTGRASFAQGALSMAGILLANVPAAIITLPLILFWGLAHGQRKSRRRGLALLGLNLLCAMALAGFYWVPAVAELPHVQIQYAYLPWVLGIRNNFLDLAQLLSWPEPFDPNLVHSTVQLSFNLGTVLLAALGIVSIQRSQSSTRTAALAWLILIILILSMLPVSLRVWEASRLGGLIQFPWRLLGPASLFLALAAAPAANRLKSPWWIAAAWAVCFVASLPWTFGNWSRPPQAPGVEDLRNYELTTGQLGATAAAEFLPKGVAELPPPRQNLPESLTLLDPAAVPPGLEFLSSESRPLEAEYRINAEEATPLTLEVFYFPGWRVTLDGKPVAIRVSEPHGLILVDLPAGTHTLRVWFGSTAPRDLGTTISLMGVVLLAVAWFRLPPLRRSDPESEASADALDNRRLPTSILLASTALALLVFRVTLVDGGPKPFIRTRFDGASVSGVGTPLNVNFEDRYQLMGLDGPASVVSGSSIPVTLYWRALSPPDADYSTSLRLIDSEGRLFGRSDRWDPGGVPTTRWRTDRYAIDEHVLPVLPGTPPGMYRLVSMVYRTSDLSMLSIIDENGLAIGPFAQVSDIDITRPQAPPTWDSLDFASLSRHSFGPIQLIGYTLPEGPVTPGQVLDVTVYWAALRPATKDLTGEFILASGDEYLRSTPVRLARADYPTSLWGEGEVVRGILSFPIPADAAAGPATLSLRVLGDGQDYGPLRLGTLQVNALVRRTDLPDVPYPLDVVLGGKIRLRGYGWEVSAGEMTVNLYWESLGAVTRNYTVFVHLLDSDGRVAAQSDAPPLDGSRPTSGWLPGEFLVDPYRLQAQSGRFLVEVGMYEPSTGVRLTTQHGEDHVVLGSVTVP